MWRYYPPPDQILDYLRCLAQYGNPVAQEMLVHTANVHRASFDRAVFSPVARQAKGSLGALHTGVNTATAAAAAIRQVETALTPHVSIPNALLKG